MAKKKDKVSEPEQGKKAVSNKELASIYKNQLNKGKNDILVQIYSEDEVEELERVSSGVPNLDRIMGGGANGYGWPRGKLNGIAGPYSSGKSTLTITTIAEFQKIGLCVLVDTENSYDPMYAKKLGVEIDELLIVNPPHSEMAFDTVFALIKTDDVRLVVIDTLDYLQPLAVINAESKDQFMGGAAKANNRFIAHLIELCRKHDCTAIIVSQIRQKIGGYGNPEVIGGGTSINYGPHVRVEIRKESILKDEAGDEYGQVSKFKITKNKTDIPQRTTTANLIWGEGFDKISDYIDIAIDMGVISKGGAGWHDYEGLKVQGKEKLSDMLKSDEDMLNKLKEKIGM
jgi:recombination protein RecA